MKGNKRWLTMAVNFNKKTGERQEEKWSWKVRTKAGCRGRQKCWALKENPFWDSHCAATDAFISSKSTKTHQENLTKRWKWKFQFTITFEQKFKKRWKLHLKTESGNCATVLVVLYNNVHVSEDKHADKRLNATYWGDNSSGVSPFNKLFHSLNHHFHWESVLVHGGIHHPKRQLTCAR